MQKLKSISALKSFIQVKYASMRNETSIATEKATASTVDVVIPVSPTSRDSKGKERASSSPPLTTTAPLASHVRSSHIILIIA
jgi:hypothetical protein